MARRPSFSFLLHAGLTAEALNSAAEPGRPDGEGEEAPARAPAGRLARLWRRLAAALARRG